MREYLAGLHPNTVPPMERPAYHHHRNGDTQPSNTAPPPPPQQRHTLVTGDSGSSSLNSSGIIYRNPATANISLHHVKGTLKTSTVAVSGAWTSHGSRPVPDPDQPSPPTGVNTPNRNRGMIHTTANDGDGEAGQLQQQQVDNNLNAGTPLSLNSHRAKSTSTSTTAAAVVTAAASGGKQCGGGGDVHDGASPQARGKGDCGGDGEEVPAATALTSTSTVDAATQHLLPKVDPGTRHMHSPGSHIGVLRPPLQGRTRSFAHHARTSRVQHMAQRAENSAPPSPSPLTPQTFLKPMAHGLATDAVTGSATPSTPADASNVELAMVHSPPKLMPIASAASSTTAPLKEPVGSVLPEVMEACRTFIRHLPPEWAKPALRAVTLQCATLQVPPRVLRSSTVFEAYTELKGELDMKPAPTAAAAAAQTSIMTVDLLQLLSVAPALLRYRFTNSTNTKVEELFTGFRSNVQTACRTDASIRRYIYLPHLQRDAHFGAVLAQSVSRLVHPGPHLASDAATASLPGHHGAASTPTATTAPDLIHVRAYAAVSFEGMPSIFLKDRHQVLQAAAVSTGSTASGQHHQSSYGGRRRRHIAPFYERELVATLACGWKEAAVFTTTLAPEFLVGLPSFLKRPEHAVPLAIAATLHRMYIAITLELQMQACLCPPSPSVPANLSTLAPRPNAQLASALPPLPPLRGPSVDMGMIYIRNTIVCSATTPGMTTYLIFLHQLAYNGDSPMVADSPSLPPCRAFLRLEEGPGGLPKEDARGKAAASNAVPATHQTYELPAIRHAAVEMTQLGAWMTDPRSHDTRHGRPFLCDLEFVDNYIPELQPPRESSVCEPIPNLETEDWALYPCAIVLATAELWAALSPAEVSNLLRVFFVLDRHAQRLMELDSPDYLPDAPLTKKDGAAASDGTRRQHQPNKLSAIAGSAAHPSAPTFTTAVLSQRAESYLKSLRLFRPDTLQRMKTFFLCRVQYYMEVSERRSKSSEMLIREDLQRIIGQRDGGGHNSSNSSDLPHSSGGEAPRGSTMDGNMKTLCDALAVALSREAAAAQQCLSSMPSSSSSLSPGSCGGLGEEAPTLTSSVVVVMVPLRDVPRRS